jgi:serine protease
MKKITLFAGLFLSLGTLLAVAKDNKHLINNGRSAFVMPENITPSDYMSNTLIFKVKSNYRSQCSVDGISIAPLNQVLMELGATKVEKMFPFAKAPKERVNKLNQAYADLTLVYILKFENNIDLSNAINKVIKTNTVEYSQPYYIQRFNYTPNDYNSSQQSFLNQIKALQAWDVNKGDTNVVIGIVDSGTDIDHPDLRANFKRNYADPINGIDDDNDGYKDNYWGIDLAGATFANIQWDNDPDVKGNNQGHGVHVSGDASAVTDNGTGVAGVGFNCKLLPVKCGADDDSRANGSGYILTGYQGITYAADHGANVINCSWGGQGAGPLEQEVINYATINKGSLVVAAAGNDNVATPYFPSSLEYVINVASVGSTDAKSSFSNFGYSIDLCAPGSNIRSTTYNNAYGSMSGTSMASPVAAGAAAIVKSQFPNYTMLQVGEQLRVTCDNINSVNSSYTNRLGSGRINLFNALTANKPSLRSQNRVVTDKNDDAIVANDTMRISMDFVNYLAPTTNATVTLTAVAGGGFVTILNGTYTIGQLNTLALANNGSVPFSVRVRPTAPANQLISFKLTYTDNATSYSSAEYFDVYVNVDYININVNQVATSITSKGRIGYNASGQGQGIGFTYKGTNVLYEGSLMIGNASKVSDMARNNAGGADEDFVSSVKVSKVGPLVSDFDAYGKFNDGGNTKGALPVSVKHYAYAWSQAPNDKYIMVRYIIQNTGTTPLNDIYAGIFCDYDIDDYTKNKGDQDDALRLGYSYTLSANVVYAGVKLLSSGPFIHHAIDNVGGATPVDFTNGSDFDFKKDSVMKISKPQDNYGTAGGDVIQTVSSGPFTIAAGDSVEVAFALLAGDDVNDIKGSATAAQTKYDELFTPTGIYAAKNEGFGMKAIYPNPSKGNTSVLINLNRDSNVKIEVLNLAGQTVYTLIKELNQGENKIDLALDKLAAGQYIVKFVNDDKVQSQKLTIIE